MPGAGQLRQFVVRCEAEEDKFLLLYALLKLALLRGRALLFVSSLSRCYRLKLFLEQFGIAACALNSELPARSRYGGGGKGWGERDGGKKVGAQGWGKGWGWGVQGWGEKGEGRDGDWDGGAGMETQRWGLGWGGWDGGTGMGAQG